MAKEIRSIDVANEVEEFYIENYQRFGWKLVSSQRVYNQSSTPVGAVTYKGEYRDYTDVRSETYITDFTKLLFERERNMPHYEKLVELEDEFWELTETALPGRPPLPHFQFTIEDWVKTVDPVPDLHTVFDIIALKLMLAGLPIGLVLILLINAFFYFNDALACSILLLSVLSFVVGLILDSDKRLVKIALKKPHSKYRKRLEAKYREYRVEYYQKLKEVENYDRTIQRMKWIVSNANNLLGQ